MITAELDIKPVKQIIYRNIDALGQYGFVVDRIKRMLDGAFEMLNTPES